MRQIQGFEAQKIQIEHDYKPMFISYKYLKNLCKISLENILEIFALQLRVQILTYAFQIDHFYRERRKLNQKECKDLALNFDCTKYAFYTPSTSKVQFRLRQSLGIKRSSKGSYS